jgi:hypothetical protein
MPTQNTKRIKIAWWNTSIAPPGCCQRRDSDEGIVTEVIEHMLDDGVDFLALGEVDKLYMNKMTQCFAHSEFEILDLTTTERNRRFFDVGVIVNSKTIQYHRHMNITNKHRGRLLKIAVGLECEVDTQPIRFYISHWPSRRESEGTDSRNIIAQNLKSQTDTVRSHTDGLSTYTILMGDYNDEPFDKSLEIYLSAYRDRALVRKRNDSFYNPFWRSVGDTNAYDGNRDSDKPQLGTCYHRSGYETRWRTFDQIIFSSSFIGNGEWRLRDLDTNVERLERLIPLVTKGTSVLDHYPVSCVIEQYKEKEESND